MEELAEGAERARREAELERRKLRAAEREAERERAERLQLRAEIAGLSAQLLPGGEGEATAEGDDDGREAMIEADCKAKDLKTVHSLYCHCRSKKQSGCHYHAVVLFARGVDYLRCLCS